MKKILLLSLFASLLFASSCSLYWDGMIGSDFQVQPVVFQVEPDDAQILLDGRFIGEAFEFSTVESALRLRSRGHEIIIKKKGYLEEVVNLNQYDTRLITIRITMKKDPAILSEKKMEEALPEKEKPEYKAKTEPIKKQPETPPLEKQTTDQMVIVHFDIEPPEAAIYLNGKFWGIAPKTGKIENLRLASGSYTIQVIKPDYTSVKKIFELKDQKQVTITVKLEKKGKEDALIL
jgi:hypothetical protein